MSNWIGPITVVAVGGAGTSVGTAYSQVPAEGIVVAVLFNFHSSGAAATIVTTVSTKGTLAPAYNLLVRTNSITAGPFAPTAIAQDTTGASLTYDGTHTAIADLAIDDFLKLVISGANNNDQIDVYILLE